MAVDLPSSELHCPPCPLGKVESDLARLSTVAAERLVHDEEVTVATYLDDPDAALEQLEDDKKFGTAALNPVVEHGQAAIDCGETIKAGKCYFFAARMITAESSKIVRKPFRAVGDN